MPHITADRVRDLTTTTGTGTVTVAATPPTTYRTFSAVLSVADTFPYFIVHQTANEWEVGIGTYSAANQFTRGEVTASSNAGAAVNFSAGTKDVVLSHIAADTPTLRDGNTFSNENVFLGSQTIVTDEAADEPLELVNEHDSASVQLMELTGARATPTAGDTGYISLKLNNSAVAETEFARITWGAGIVTDGDEHGFVNILLAVEGDLETIVSINTDDGVTVDEDLTVNGGNLVINSTDALGVELSGFTYSASVNGTYIRGYKSRHATFGSHTAVNAGDVPLYLVGYVSDGDEFLPIASIRFQAAANAANGDVPGQIIFAVTADGASTPTDWLSLGDGGLFTVGTAGTNNAPLRAIGNNDCSILVDSDSSATIRTQLASQETGTVGNVGTVTNHNFIISSNNTSRIQVGAAGTLQYAPGGTFPTLQVFDAIDSTVTPNFQISGTDGNTTAVSLARYSADAAGPRLILGKSRHATVGSHTVVQSGDVVGEFLFSASDGTNFESGAGFRAVIGAGAGDGDVPTRIEFVTTGDGGSAYTHRARLDHEGRFIIGSADNDTGVASYFKVLGTTADSSSMTIARFSNDANDSDIRILKSRNAGLGGFTIVQNNDEVGAIDFLADDGNSWVTAARIKVYVDGTPGDGDMPGRFVIETTADAASSGTARLTINNAGLATFSDDVKITEHIRTTAPVTKTGDFSVAVTENYLICNGSGTITVTMPTASSFTGREIWFKNITAQTINSNASNVVPNTTGTAGTAILPNTDGAWCMVVSDGTNWIRMASSTIA